MVDQPNLPEGRDVEDVLSSIRRLVSSETEARLNESHRAFTQQTKRPPANGDAAPTGGQTKPLLLSSALRVEADDGAASTSEGVMDNGAGDTGDGVATNGAGSGELLRLVPANRVDPDTDPAPVLEAAPTGAEAEEDIADLALRELVRSVLREELEGEIGDRISRHLTQYVRQEVAKAVAELKKT